MSNDGDDFDEIIKLALAAARLGNRVFNNPAELGTYLRDEYYVEAKDLNCNKKRLLDCWMDYRKNQVAVAPPSPPNSNIRPASYESQEGRPHLRVRPTWDEEVRYSCCPLTHWQQLTWSAQQKPDFPYCVCNQGELLPLTGVYCKEKENFIGRDWLVDNALEPDDDGTIILRFSLSEEGSRGKRTYRSRFIVLDEMEWDSMLGTGYRDGVRNASDSSQAEGSIASRSINGDDHPARKPPSISHRADGIGSTPVMDYLRRQSNAANGVLSPVAIDDSAEVELVATRILKDVVPAIAQTLVQQRRDSIERRAINDRS